MTKNMKHIIFYGPGSSPYIVVSAEEAKLIEENFKDGKSFDITYDKGASVLHIRENQCLSLIHI